MSRTKTHTAKSTFRAIDQILSTLTNLINNEFLSDEDNKMIYEMYQNTSELWQSAKKTAIKAGVWKE